MTNAQRGRETSEPATEEIMATVHLVMRRRRGAEVPAEATR